MIKLDITQKRFTIILDDKTYVLVQDIIGDDEFIEVYDSDNKCVDNNTWNNVVNYWENIIEE